MARTYLVKLVKYFLLIFQIFSNRFDDHIAGAELGEMCHFLDTAQNQLLLSLGNRPFLQLLIEICLDHLIGVVQSLCVFLHQ
ncbi:hypothetical protein D3C80_1984370 [compost metagenome]